MKKIAIITALILILILSGCTEAVKENSESESNWNEMTWEEHLQASKGTSVNLHMWGGSDLVNNYIDQFVAPRLEEKYAIRLNRVPITDARDMINKLITEKDVDKTDGSIDLMWINGENFALSKENNLLLGSYADLIPNYSALIDTSAKDNLYDFGLATDGMEVPWGKSQFVFVYDSAKIETPPASMTELLEFAKNNPGKFTYPAPPDFTGSAFVRNAMIEMQENGDRFLENLSNEELDQLAQPGLDILSQMKPYLWREGMTYPENSGKLDQLYRAGEVWMTMSYNPVHAQSMIDSGQFPETSKTFVLDNGTLSNTHYLAVPFNTTNASGAFVVINEMISFEAQLEKFKPSVWGDGLAISVNKLSDSEKDMVNSVDRGQSTLSPEVLGNHKIPEMSASYVEVLEDLWYESIAK
ncbi:ABC transporter substrate-binding protein [Fusibacter sp. JL216-2]|uniref:ABC transporter substrate-binding protein n=1 Tax=Fusibacter sp. JL216-2 TaxID=3071453 RepID=UPI003D330954